MDKLYDYTPEKAGEALKRVIEKMNCNSPIACDELYHEICFLLSNEFADEVTDIVAAEHNTYNRLEQIRRMNNIIDMLAYGIPQEKVKEIIELQLDDFAVNFIRWKGV